jgi:glycosyltransferase involved in cell wall biosynthesis
VTARIPIVSVAMKAYNHAPFVSAAVRSILDQTFDDFEFVITDDGSSDATPEIIAGFDDPRIRFERFPENRGIAAAMHATVQRSRGEFIAIMNSDDVSMPRRLERQVAFLRERPDVAATFCVPQEIDDEGRKLAPTGIFRVPFSTAFPSRTEWLRHFFFAGNCLCAPSAMIRRASFVELGPDDPRLHLLGDLDRWVRLLTRSEIFVMDEPLVAFRWRHDRGNASVAGAATARRNAFETFQILRRYRDFPSELLHAIFGEDIARMGIDTERARRVWLAEIALLGGQPWHRLLAMETLFASATDRADLRRLDELSGSLDIFAATA